MSESTDCVSCKQCWTPAVKCRRPELRWPICVETTSSSAESLKSPPGSEPAATNINKYSEKEQIQKWRMSESTDRLSCKQCWISADKCRRPELWWPIWNLQIQSGQLFCSSSGLGIILCGLGIILEHLVFQDNVTRAKLTLILKLTIREIFEERRKTEMWHQYECPKVLIACLVSSAGRRRFQPSNAGDRSFDCRYGT